MINLVTMFIFPGDIRTGTASRGLHYSLGDPTMYRFLRSPLTTFIVSNPTSLLCLTIAILSFTTQYAPGFHLVNICNTICLTILTAFITTRTPSPNPATRTSDASQTHSPSPPSCVPQLPPTPDRCMLHHSVEGGCPGGKRFGRGSHLSTSDSISFLDLSSEESFHGMVSR